MTRTLLIGNIIISITFAITLKPDVVKGTCACLVSRSVQYKKHGSHPCPILCYLCRRREGGPSRTRIHRPPIPGMARPLPPATQHGPLTCCIDRRPVSKAKTTVVSRPSRNSGDRGIHAGTSDAAAQPRPSAASKPPGCRQPQQTRSGICDRLPNTQVRRRLRAPIL